MGFLFQMKWPKILLMFHEVWFYINKLLSTPVYLYEFIIISYERVAQKFKIESRQKNVRYIFILAS